MQMQNASSADLLQFLSYINICLIKLFSNQMWSNCYFLFICNCSASSIYYYLFMYNLSHTVFTAESFFLSLQNLRQDKRNQEKLIRQVDNLRISLLSKLKANVDPMPFWTLIMIVFVFCFMVKGEREGKTNNNSIIDIIISLKI